VGTSLEVYPANSLVDFSRGRIVFVGKGTSRLNRYVDLLVNEDIDSFFRSVSFYLKDLW
jgi:NAD-dependent SIR2 family protein deacetylase